MKILAVRLRNLNSLAGSWAIDFTAPELAAAGIFAITGPTGAGKSTILDALCLALFARTPRLGHISKGSNEIMARRTGDCFAEVDFETGQGCFRCHWAQHRARRSPGGELQPPRHELVDIRTGRVLESRSKEVGRLVEQVTGMDYDRFTRSILLAQGDFAAFLEADADQRAPLLEQITGTGIYSRISVAVHERTSEERQKTAALRETMGRVVLLDEAEEQELAAGIREHQAVTTVLGERLARLGQALHRLEAIARLRTQIAETDRLLEHLAHRRQAAQNDLVRLDRGRRAQTLLAEYTQWCQTEERLGALRGKESALAAELERQRRERQRAAIDHDLAVRTLAETRALRQREDETIAIVRALDLRLHEKRQVMVQSRALWQQSEQERNQSLQQRHELERRLDEIADQQEQFAAFFRDRAGDGLLVEQLAGFRQQLHQVSAREQALPTVQRELATCSATHGAAQQQVIILEREREQANKELALEQQRQQALRAQRDTLLAGQELPAWRHRMEAETERWHRLEQAAELLAGLRATETELVTLERSRLELLTRQQQDTDRLGTFEEQRRLREQLLRQCELNQQLSVRIRSFEEERERLRAGAPCPLCGATSHPWAEQRPESEKADKTNEALLQARAELEAAGTAVAGVRETLAGLARDIDHNELAGARGQQQREEWKARLSPLLALFGDTAEVDRLRAQGSGQLEELRRRVQEVDRLEDALHAAHSRGEQATARHHELLQRAQGARHEVDALDADLRRLGLQLEDEQSRLATCRADLVRQLQPLGIDACLPGQADTLARHLEHRLRTWKERQGQDAALTEQRNRLRAECATLDLLLATVDKSLAQQTARLAELETETGGLQAERRERYGDRDPDVEEQRLRAEGEQAEAREQTSRARLIEADRQQHGLEEQARLNAEESATLVPVGRAQAARLLDLLPSAGFTGLSEYRAALLPPATLAALDTLNQELDREQATLAARRAEQAAALLREEQQRQDERGQEDLSAEQAEVNQELAAVQQRIGSSRERLQANDRNRCEFAARQRDLAAQQRELERWELLHLLIGSADGKKFRIFAQGLTFEVVISHANHQLRRMSDRYLLLRDPREPLALQVIDNYQAGEIRSTRNLSGGESFLVSLALALGLSAMASHHVRVDSLFLDEGFGTLDEESLDTALQTLAELRQDGKLIGIISHVPLLRERIDLRIRVQPGPGGTSCLLGPGCARLA
ncbi:MAG: AAA family ATPase [Desulfobulbus sp.]|uniref:AAA family ATPase n=1 Tax=Desulfobulbus sp. TaxID=895 RepID=UPI00284368BD|nr:AAA family ATPase [Desulfobulbus sp.]MDR2551162.1 AAA family ATPase [Desulfobulbus sp.]